MKRKLRFSPDSTDPETQGERLAKHYPIVVIKRGAAGAEALEGGRRWRIKEAGNKPVNISGVRDPGVAALLAEGARRFGVKTSKIEVVDTTGAGDAFAAGFLAARLTGAEIRIALARAAAEGALRFDNHRRDSQGGRRFIAADSYHHFF